MKIFAPFLLLLILVLLCNANSQTSDFLNQANRSCFIQNKGQWDKSVLYLAKSNGMNAWITKNGVVYDYYKINRVNDSVSTLKQHKDNIKLDHKKQEMQSTVSGHVVNMTFENASDNIQVSGKGKYQTVYNYFLGNDSTKWASNVELNKEIIIGSIYPGVSIRYYWESDSTGRQCLRYDYIVSPNADISKIKMNFKGQDDLHINNNGELVLRTSIGEIVHQKLYAYESAANGALAAKTNPVDCKFIKNIDNSISFDVNNYDKTKTLVIDPLVWSTYIGGETWDEIISVILEDDGSIIAFGCSQSEDFHKFCGAYINNDVNIMLGFLIHLSSDEKYVLSATYVGTIAGTEDFTQVIKDKDNNIYICGNTSSNNYPVTPNAFQKVNAGQFDIYVSKFNPSCTALLYSTYFGGSSSDFSSSMCVDELENVYLYGRTFDAIPTTSNSFQPTKPGGNQDALVFKLNSTGSDVIFSTYIGGNNNDFAGQICLDELNNFIITGFTDSDDFPITPNSLQKTLDSAGNGFITKINSAGTTLIFSTYFAYKTSGVDVDKNGNIYVKGVTTKNIDFPSVGTPFFHINSPNDGSTFLAKISPDGNTLLYCGAIAPGDGFEGFYGKHDLKVENENRIYTCINLSTPGFYTSLNALHSNFSGSIDTYFALYDLTNPVPVYATYIGGSYVDEYYSLDKGIDGSVVIAGMTYSRDFPVSAGCYDNVLNDGISTMGYDGFITKFLISDCSIINSDIDKIELGNRSCQGDTAVTITLSNDGYTTVEITDTYFFNKNSKLYLVNGGNFSLNPNETRHLAINIKPDSSGILNDTLFISIDNGCSNLIKIPITGTLNKYSLTTNVNDTLSFGAVETYSSQIKTLKLKNTGNINIDIQAPENIQAPFALVKTIPALPYSLKPGEEISYDISYSPKKAGFDTLLINQFISKPCNLTLPINLTGNSSYDGTAECNVYIQSGKTKTGDKINLPLMLKSSKNLIYDNNPVKFTAVISFNPTILIPNFAFTNSQVLPKMRTISIEGVATNASGLLKDLPFTVCLGNSVCTDIIIDTLIWQSNSHIKTETENGTFCITNICPEGGVRLIDPNSSVGFTKISPNPAENSLEIEFSLSETAHTEISIYNVLGIKVKTLMNQYITDYNLSKINADISDLSSGQYIIILSTPTFLQSAQIKVIR